MMINGKVSAKKIICKCNANSGKCKWKNEKNKKISTASFQKWKCAAVTSTLAMTSNTTLTASPITDVPNTSASVTSEPDTTACTTITTTQSTTKSSALTTVSGVLSPILSDYDFVETSFGYIFYKSFNPASRSEARQTCENDNTTLPIPRSAEENNIYIQLASYEINWLGMSDSQEEGVWKADDETDIIWFNWRQGEPNNAFGGEHGVMMDKNGKWNDLREHEERKFICIFKIPVDYTYERTTFGDVFYKHYGSMSRTEGAQLCASENSFLPIPRSAAENAFYANWGGYRWLGVSDEESEGYWMGDDGFPIEWFKWNKGEPNNDNGVEHGVETYNHGYWNDKEETFQRKVTCVIKVPYIKETTPAPTDIPVPGFEPLSHYIPDLISCDNNQNKAKIVGGHDAVPNSWPWIIQLAFQSEEQIAAGLEVGGIFSSRCSGTILNKNWILTAAHCCQSRDPNSPRVKVTMYFGNGKFNLIIDNFETNVFVHDGFEKEPGHNNDICLMKIQESDLFAVGQDKGCGIGCINAACLPTEPAVHGDACWVAGWGRLSHGGEYPSVMQETGLNIFSREYCLANTNYDVVKPEEFCAGQPDRDGDNLVEGGLDVCSGDSGGPVICEVEGKAVVNGIVHGGVGCGWEGYGKKYVEVFDHDDWIRSTIRENTP